MMSQRRTIRLAAAHFVHTSSKKFASKVLRYLAWNLPRHGWLQRSVFAFNGLINDVQQRVVRVARSTSLAHRHRHQPVSERGGGGLPLMSCQRFDCLSEFDCPISSDKYCRSSAYRYAHGIA